MIHLWAVAKLSPGLIPLELMMEHRCGTRHRVDIAVYTHSHGGIVASVGFLRDISAGGTFLLTSLPLPLLARLVLRLIDSEGEFGPRLEGHVVRRVAEGVGIEWSDYMPELIRSLGIIGVSEGENLASDPAQADDHADASEASALDHPAPRPRTSR